jgi:lipoprotein-releasing system permease protein
VNVEWYIATRLFKEKENRNTLSRRIINIALTGIALGIVLMLLSVAVVTGFKKEIRDKVIGFGSHIQLVNYDSNLSFETAPVKKNQPFLSRLTTIENIQKVSPFATKPGIIKTTENIQGVVLKGVDASYNHDFFASHLIEGKLPDFTGPRSGDVLISENLCTRLFLKLKDPLYMYFVNEGERLPRLRQFNISGIYRTHLQEFDDLFVICDLRQIQHVNSWDSTQISGFEIYLHDFDALDKTALLVREKVANYTIEPGSTLRVVTIRQKYPQLFDWLSILDMNVWVILILMVTVAGFNMISALLVLILERSRMIGTLKAMGCRNKSIRNIFLYLSGLLISRGLFWGNSVGIVLLLIQKYFQPFRLDPASYYMEIVPVHISLLHLVLLNTGAMVITLMMLVFPALFIGRISPEKILRFD